MATGSKRASPVLTMQLSERKNLPLPETMSNRSTLSAGQSLLIAFLAAAILTIFVSKVFCPVFETNDDVILSMICSGLGFARQPDSHMLFSSLAVGTVLSKLYAINEHVPWYGLYLFASNLVSTTVIFFSILWRRSLSFGVGLSLTFFACALLHILLFVQFTTTASLLSVAALVLLVKITELRKIDWRLYIAPLCMLVFSSLIRIQSLQLFACLGVLLFLTGPADFRKQRYWALSVLGISLALGMAFHHLSYALYDLDQGWGHFPRMNPVVSMFINFGQSQSLPANSKLPSQVGWTNTDLQMLTNWNYIDRENFSIEKLEKISKLIPVATVPLSVKLERLKSLFEDFSLLPMVLSILFCLPFIKREQWLRFGLLWAGTAAIIVLLCLFIKIESRAYYPMFCLLNFFVFNALDQKALQEAFRNKRLVALSAISLVILGMAYAAWFEKIFLEPERVVKRLRQSVQHSLAAIHPSSSQLYVGWQFPYDAVLPYEDQTKYFRDLVVLPVNALCQTPVTADILKKYGIENLFTQLTNPNIRVLSTSDENDLLAQYVLEHYHQKIKFVRMYDLVTRLAPGKTSGYTYNIGVYQPIPSVGQMQSAPTNR
jgi:hypothetical protein